MNYRKLLLIFGIFLFLVGAVGLAPIGYYWYRDHQLKSAFIPQVQAEPAQDPPREFISGQPKRLLIPELGMDLQVTEGFYNESTRQWTLSNDKVHFAEFSVMPNDFEGNTLIYGHYRPEVFARLHNIQPDAKVTVLTNNNYKFIYKYRKNQVTGPSDASVFTYTGKPLLTLQTCTGAWMQNRQLFTFDLVNVEKLK